MENLKNHKGLLFLCIILASLVISLSAILLTITISKPASASENVAQITSDIQKNYLYCIKEYDGKIGVFSPDNSTPIQIIETNPALLPEYDQEMLKSGIYLYSNEELRQLTEDFDG